MKTNTGHITEILYKQLAGEILTAAEKADLDQWVSSFAANRQVFEEIQEVKGLDSYLQNIYNDEKTDKALELFEARHSFQSITESGNASNNPGPSTPNPFNGLSKSSETNQSESSETTQSSSSENKQSKSSESTQSESSENKQSKSSESNQSKSSESNLSKSSETNQFRSSVLTTTQVDVGAPGSIFILPGRRRTWFRYAVAAVVVLIGTAVAFFVALDRHGVRSGRQMAVASDILPGGQRAILTLADGKSILLHTAAIGRLADQGGVQVLKQEDGQIIYDGRAGSGPEMINTMSTPRGGQYRLTLPDGTQVWLNAASSITYPTAFTGKERTVRVTGEVYMEVAPNSKKPFIVNVDDKSSIEVLGTSFNINSYDDHKNIKTTLVDGSIRIAKLNTQVTDNNNDQATDGETRSALHINHRLTPSVILSPGQQAIIDSSPDRPPLVQQANVDQVLAWKNGLFDIEGLSLQELALQLERWYDIRVVYEGPIREIIFEGKLSRDVKLSAVLNWFSELGIGNRLEDHTLILSFSL